MEDMKKWDNMDEYEIEQNKKVLCVRCHYSGVTGVNTVKNSVAALTCDYILREGHSRKCSPINCKYFKSRGKRKPTLGAAKY